jgi:hypothetical protein
VRESKSGKGRVVARNKTVMDTLMELSKVRLFDNPYIFPGDKKGSRRTNTQVLGKVFEVSKY